MNFEFKKKKHEHNQNQWFNENTWLISWFFIVIAWESSKYIHIDYLNILIFFTEINCFCALFHFLTITKKTKLKHMIKWKQLLIIWCIICNFYKMAIFAIQTIQTLDFEKTFSEIKHIENTWYTIVIVLERPNPFYIDNKTKAIRSRIIFLIRPIKFQILWTLKNCWFSKFQCYLNICFWDNKMFSFADYKQ